MQQDRVPPLMLLALELTRACPLACKHCRAASVNRPLPGQLTTDEIFLILKNIAARYKPILILTGGEPLLRSDLEVIVKGATALGFKPVLAPCGLGFDYDKAKKLKDWGIERISLSIDGATAKTHDFLRGVDGAFGAVVEAARAAKAAGLPFQVNTTIFSGNVDEIKKIMKLAIELGAVAFHPFMLVPAGRGKKFWSESLTPEQYERALEEVADISKDLPMPIKPTCAPQFARIVRQKKIKPSASERMSRGCLAGVGFAFISSLGKIQTCGFLEVEIGDVRKSDYDFLSIWDDAPIFVKLRKKDNYKGRCGVCSFWNVCGGCRARSFGALDDYMEEDPLCIYKPGGANEVE